MQKLAFSVLIGIIYGSLTGIFVGWHYSWLYCLGSEFQRNFADLQLSFDGASLSIAKSFGILGGAVGLAANIFSIPSITSRFTLPAWIFGSTCVAQLIWMAGMNSIWFIHFSFPIAWFAYVCEFLCRDLGFGFGSLSEHIVSHGNIRLILIAAVWGVLAGLSANTVCLVFEKGYGAPTKLGNTRD